MRKIFLSTFAALALLLLPVSALADSHSGYGNTEVSGRVHHYSRHDNKETKVTVSCNGHERSTRTNNRDGYSVRFSNKECKKNDRIEVRTEHHGHYGRNHGHSDSKGHCHIDVDDGPPTDVPEFGTMASIAAGVIGAGAFLVIRHRQFSGHQA